MLRLVPKICGVEGESRGKGGPKYVFRRQILGRAPENFVGQNFDTTFEFDLLSKFGSDPMAGLSSMLTK